MSDTDDIDGGQLRDVLAGVLPVLVDPALLEAGHLEAAVRSQGR